MCPVAPCVVVGGDCVSCRLTEGGLGAAGCGCVAVGFCVLGVVLKIFLGETVLTLVMWLGWMPSQQEAFVC